MTFYSDKTNCEMNIPFGYTEAEFDFGVGMTYNGNTVNFPSDPKRSSTGTAFLFKAQGSSAASGSKIYYFAIYEDGSKVQELIPCRRKTDGELGMYDTVTDTFLTNAGTGTFTAGKVIGHVDVIGTPEVITVSGGVSAQTATVENLYAVGSYKDEQEIIGGGVTHRVGIKVLNGTEEWTTDTYGGSRRMVMQDIINASGSTLPVICSHYVFRPTDERQQPNSIFIAGTGKIVVYIASTQSITTVAEFNAWLASQYAAGTPVIMVYPLVQETTEQVTAQPVTGTMARITQTSIDGLEIQTKEQNELIKRYITDDNGTPQEVIKVYIGNDIVWER